MTDFPITERSRLKRAHQRGHFDRETVYAVLDSAMLAHIGTVIAGQNFVTPTFYWRRGDSLYWHGSSASRMIRAHAQGSDVCVTVTHLDGLVLARSAFHHSANYRSVMAFGRTRLVENDEEKTRELDAFVERIYPGRLSSLRPMNAKEFKATSVIVMEIQEASAKIRTGPPIDDEEDYGLACWAGTIAIEERVGAVAPDPRLAPSTEIPGEVRRFAAGQRLELLLGRSE
jgi:nitroimidazol reductase NimA-like FMN-containing flavoprotein (pyridoxamine 5'-phosphate oxidase superfamily)